MPRKGSEWKDAASGLIAKAKSVEEREAIPEKACGKCKEFGARQFTQDGTGWCGVLKGGSNLKSTPPVFVTEGESAYLTLWNMDASKCKYYNEMEFIDHTGEEVADPAWSRVYRQMAK